MTALKFAEGKAFNDIVEYLKGKGAESADLF